jgi:NTP pyrophosphatase (non-canonical NTP hydrolase)
MNPLDELRMEVRAFSEARNWFQYQSPKNLVMAIAGEAGELVAEFQWLTFDESNVGAMTTEKLEAVRLEIADVFIYLLRLSDELDFDLSDAVREKMKLNELRFPT